ncbi:MAG: cold shock domain-containing protein, partial [Acidobacteria bacterium]|nr:cold shock domain-containing protein [Acidobacteriota bacterium]
MPQVGTLKTWNEDRGFGFILPASGGPELFVHIKAFPRNTPPPAVGETVFYEAGYGNDGRARATHAYFYFVRFP